MDASLFPRGDTGRHRAGLAPLLTIRGLADLLGTSEKTVRRMVCAGRIPCVRFGRQIRFLPGDVFRWLEARKEG
jgi:excisionase family DNA binding protein